MRLCLDEHYARDIAAQLRKRGHDVTCVKERPDLVGMPDAELVRVMQAERSALLTENVADFAPLAQSLVAAGEHHWGFVFSSPRSMPRGTNTIGVFVEALDGFLAQRPNEDDCRNEVAWLQPPNLGKGPPAMTQGRLSLHGSGRTILTER